MIGNFFPSFRRIENVLKLACDISDGEEKSLRKQSHASSAELPVVLGPHAAGTRARAGPAGWLRDLPAPRACPQHVPALSAPELGSALRCDRLEILDHF